MRRAVLAFIVINVIFVTYAVFSVRTLLTLLVVDGHEDAILKADLPRPGQEDQLGGRKQLIPKIIHQTYANASIPEVWEDAQRSCIDLHPDYEYRLWTDESAREFIAAEYPWFLDTFDGYKFGIQRADAIRYFVLAHFGGIYIDLDDGCQRRLDPLLTYPAWLRRTIPTGISNDVMGSVPRHPFFVKVIESLQRYNRNWGLPYITVMGSTGPLFLSVLWRHHVNSWPAASDRVHILFPEEYTKSTWAFFKYNLGNSWHQYDVEIIMWVSKHGSSL
jgi:mannosyltransferase OCH1-like enzyme